MSKVLIVGGGLTSAVTASLLNKSIQIPNTELCVWDKARGCGGRMSTSRLSSSLKITCSADLGAQYITATSEYQRRHSKYYEELKSNELITPLKLPIEGQKPNQHTTDYVCPSGSSSLVKHFFNKASVQVQYDKRVTKIDTSEQQWRVSTEYGDIESFDAVILTMPVPQILELLSHTPEIDIGNMQDTESVTSKLSEVQYSSRYAIALLYDCDDENEKEDIKNTVKLENGACAKYIYGDSIFRYVSLDSYKRANISNPSSSDMIPMSVVFHTSVPFGIEHIEKSPEDVKPLLLNHINEIFPKWPKPTAVKCQKWKYSQVQKAYSGEPGCLELCKTPLLLAGGDGFTHSNFDGCIRSAEAVANHFLQRNN